jgi:RHS repeat-associated protein
MLMPGRMNSTDAYRWGFNGKEKDNEWTSTPGATYDYGFRIYDSRIGKFLSVDPLNKDYPMLTPYQFASNTPIWAIDLDGLEAYYTPNGAFYGWGSITGDNAPTMCVTVKERRLKDRETGEIEYLYYIDEVTDLNIKYGDFQKFAATVYNEGSPDIQGKKEVASALMNRKEHKDFSSGSWENMLNRVMFWKDTHEKKMSETERKGDNDEVYPKNMGGDGNFKYQDVSTVKYREFINSTPAKQNESKEMKASNEAAIDKFNGGKDEVDGKNAWYGDGKKNHFYKMKGTK